MEKIREKARTIFLLFFAGLVILIWYLVFYAERHQNLWVTFFDVGQGDSAFIETPAGTQILIDGGPDNKILSKLGRELPFWDKSIDVLLLTHTHADHLDGLLGVLKRYDVGLVIESGANDSLSEYQDWQNLLAQKKIPMVIAQAGEKINLANDVELDILSPLSDFAGKSVKNAHDAVVVSKLVYGKYSVLFTGDAETKVENQMLAQEKNMLPSKILKVGHHGSKTSSSPDFLRAVGAKEAIISAGRKNRYNLPSQEIVDRLSAIGLNLWRTDLAGDIKMESDGENYSIQ